jgi:4-diphosphocytidyl-2-C-methyl-D-erythritol kinase
MILYPNAKINIGLNILSKREDGFHNIETLMYPVNITDILTINTVENSNEKIVFTTTGLFIDAEPEDNLIVKAYNLLDKYYNLPSLKIHLHKSIPFGAGLGGGSADCAFVIKGINKLCNLNISEKTMEEFAAKLGSDTAFFIKNKPAMATGRGEILKSANIDLSNYKIAIVIPSVSVSTKQAYSLVKPKQPKFNLQESLKKDLDYWKTTIFNDFEASVFAQFSEIKDVKNILYKAGAIYASLSGSGSSVFGIFKSKPNLKSMFPENYFYKADL